MGTKVDRIIEAEERRGGSREAMITIIVVGAPQSYRAGGPFVPVPIARGPSCGIIKERLAATIHFEIPARGVARRTAGGACS